MVTRYNHVVPQVKTVGGEILHPRMQVERRASLALGDFHHPLEQLLTIALRTYGRPRDEVTHIEIPPPGKGFGNTKAHDSLNVFPICQVHETVAVLLLPSDLSHQLLLHEVRA